MLANAEHDLSDKLRGLVIESVVLSESLEIRLSNSMVLRVISVVEDCEVETLQVFLNDVFVATNYPSEA